MHTELSRGLGREGGPQSWPKHPVQVASGPSDLQKSSIISSGDLNPPASVPWRDAMCWEDQTSVYPLKDADSFLLPLSCHLL